MTQTKSYTAQQLLKKYRGKYIRVRNTFDYDNHQWLYEVIGTKSTIHENYNLPEDCIVN